MLKIGITGNIGSGKTTVCKVFELLGVPVFYADTEAKRLMTEDVVLVNQLKQSFGQDAFFADGKLNRKHIAGIVFNNDAALRQLNELVHPAVFRAFDVWAAGQKTQFYVLKEAALLFESGSAAQSDQTIVVSASLEERVARVMLRDGISRAEVLRREAKQIPQEEKEKLADFVIQNDNNELVIQQILRIHNQLKTLLQKA